MADKYFFSFPVEKIVKREGKADVYVFRSGLERAKASDVIRSAKKNTSSPPEGKFQKKG